ncbi:MAG: thioesterase family protein [Alphaproteobacteria bacterium]|nr:thioesterase family protein [Alphaproteobacteria bacterium]MDP6622997.1 thioesterase family protein [Alphaproteobacteria bacterium]
MASTAGLRIVAAMGDSSIPPQAAAPATVDFSDPRIYRHWCRDIIRFADLDAGGHVNNTSFATFFETGRVAFFADARGRGRAAHDPVLAVRLTFELKSELFYPGEVDIATMVTHIGNSSLTLNQALFEAGRCAATAECIMVVVDPVGRKPMRIPDALRQSMLDVAG